MATTGTASLPTLGILGGGQLGRMTALAAVRMGMRVRILTPEATGPEAAFADVIFADWTDPFVLRSFAEACDVVTVESEWAPADRLADVLPEGVALWPSPETLHLVRHKGRQREALAARGLPQPGFALCATLDEAHAAAATLGYPVVLKQYERSYDGYGNATARDAAALAEAWPKLAADDGLLVEQFVPFEDELAVHVARRADGRRVIYPIAWTEQREHRCHAVVVPAPIPEATAAEARLVAEACAEAVEVVGILGVELFRTRDGRVLVNELAPRPHNTAHYTIEGCHTSQFENHVRAVLGWPLGDPALRVPAACMVNVLGHTSGPTNLRHLPDALAVPGAAVHLYGKHDVRPRRKMGHVTVTANDPAAARAHAEEAAARLRL
ncbi:MAG TPA: 5-(carboxyamino)imidazole ribonucleotide synthase [Rubricoccaceae bacterium]|nr:5-(carboxyamino)imidazole ribonucleotide synthase [Rubricoccaceae bacterium]